MNIFKIVIILYFLFAGATCAYAHDETQPHFFKINNSYLAHYPISSTSLPDFVLPQEIVKTPLMINKQYNFQIEKQNIPLKNIILDENYFSIDFGDGEKANGTNLKHTYSHTGSYLLNILVKPPLSEKEIILTTALIHVVSNMKYVLPEAIIEVNGTLSNTDEIQASFSKPINLDASKSTGQSQIVNYFWDLGDGQASDKVILSHSYNNYHAATNILLRIKDSQGFISDSAIRIVNQKENTTASIQKSETNFFQIFIIFSIISLLIFFLFLKIKKTIDK